MSGLSPYLKNTVTKSSVGDIIGSNLNRITFVVDVASWTFPACKTVTAVEQIVTPVDGAAPAVTEYVKNKVKGLLVHDNIRVVLVLDGRKFPPKKFTHELRAAQVELAKIDLDKYERTLDHGELSTVQLKELAKKRSKVSLPREDIIHDVVKWAKEHPKVVGFSLSLGSHWGFQSSSTFNLNPFSVLSKLLLLKCMPQMRGLVILAISSSVVSILVKNISLLLSWIGFTSRFVE